MPKIYVHWVNDLTEETYVKEFFSSKTERATAEKKVKESGNKVLASFSYDVDPTAKGIVDFCREQIQLREYAEDPDTQSLVEEMAEEDDDIAGLL